MSNNPVKRESLDNLEDADDVDWEKIRRELSQHPSYTQHILQKSAENPFVPLGMVVTVGALTYGIYSFMKGDKMMSQYMMRTRVGAQALTVLAVVGGILYHRPKDQ